MRTKFIPVGQLETGDEINLGDGNFQSVYDISRDFHDHLRCDLEIGPLKEYPQYISLSACCIVEIKKSLEELIEEERSTFRLN